MSFPCDPGLIDFRDARSRRPNRHPACHPGPLSAITIEPGRNCFPPKCRVQCAWLRLAPPCGCLTNAFCVSVRHPPRLDKVRGTDSLDLTFRPVRDALADKEFSPRRRGRRNPPQAKRKLITLVWNFTPIHGLDHLRRRRQQGLTIPVNEGARASFTNAVVSIAPTPIRNPRRDCSIKNPRRWHTHLEDWRPTVAHAGHIVVPPLPV